MIDRKNAVSLVRALAVAGSTDTARTSIYDRVVCVIDTNDLEGPAEFSATNGRIACLLRPSWRHRRAWRVGFDDFRGTYVFALSAMRKAAKEWRKRGTLDVRFERRQGRLVMTDGSGEAVSMPDVVPFPSIRKILEAPSAGLPQAELRCYPDTMRRLGDVLCKFAGPTAKSVWTISPRGRSSLLRGDAHESRGTATVIGMV